MFKAIVLICIMAGNEPQCKEFYNPKLINETVEQCEAASRGFIEYMQRTMPVPLMVSYRCEYEQGV